MKLIELLARDLKEWANTTLCYVQDANGDVWPCKSEPELAGDSWGDKYEGSFIDQHDDARHLAEVEKCEDWSTAIVTRDQWETAMYSPTPTLETMLFEWRDLQARAQVAQAEADALFEHAGQCHGEIVVRLAELGWGAPRAPMVQGEPVVTLDDSDGWIEWNGGKCPVPESTIIDVKDRDGEIHESVEALQHWSNHAQYWLHRGSVADIVAYRLTPSTQP